MRLSSTKTKFDEIRETIRRWAADILDDDDAVVHAKESDPRPSGPHVSVGILGDPIRIGRNAERKTDSTTGRETTISHWEFMVSFMAVGCPNAGNDIEDKIRAEDILMELKLAMEMYSTQAFFDEINLVIADEGNIQSVPAVLETETEPRAVLDIKCRVRIEVVDETNDDESYFDNTKISGSVDTDGDGTFDKTIDEFAV